MKRVFQKIKPIISPAPLTTKDGITYWQEKVLLNLLLILAVLGLVTYLPSVALAIKERLWPIVILDTVMYIGVLILFLNRKIPFLVRAASLSFTSYLLGLILILTVGPFGAGPVWLFFFPIITGILLGQRMAFISLLLNALTLICFGFFIHFHLTDFLTSFNFTPWHIAVDNPLIKWIVIGMNFMLLNIIASLSVTTILNGLQKSMTDLAASEKKYRQIFENIQDVYFETRLDGTLSEVSPSIERLSDYSIEEARGMSLLSTYKNLEQREKTIQRLLEDGALTNHEIEFLTKDGRVLTCAVNARLLMDKDNTPYGTSGTLRDISQLKDMEREKKGLQEQLNRAKKMEAIGLLAGGVAHDLNNILSGIVTYPELLAMDLDENDPMRKTLGIIQSSGLRAAEIVQDLLTLSRRGVVARETINLNEVVTTFLRTPEYKKILSFHPNVQVEKQINADLPFLKGSFVHLQKTVMNLISNAAESQMGGGKIIVRTENRHLDKPVKGYDQVDIGDYVVLSVQDNGTGIVPEDLKRIFEPFFTKKVMGRSGTGLGMSVVWGTVQDHEGYIDIISTPNEGTTFDLYFPICTDEVTRSAKPFDTKELMGNGETILIVDDLPEQREIAGSTLEKLGYKAITKPSGEAAVEYLKTHDADLIVLDMIMEPGIDGFQTYKQILAFKPEQKAVIASGYSHTNQVEDTIKLGAGGYLQKPYTLEKIGIAVKKELDKTV